MSTEFDFNEVFSDDNQILERRDSYSSTSLLDSPCFRPLVASSAARQVPLRPLDDDEDEDHKEALVRSFHAYGQSRCDMLSSAGDGAIAMTRGKGVVGSAPSLVADWSWAAPSRRRSSVDSAFLRATPPPPFPLDASVESASQPLLEECKPVGLDDFELLHVIGQGGFGKVYQARHKESGDILAMKSMRKDTTLQYNVAGTRTERSVMEQLNGHPFICSLQYAFQTEGRLYLCMDYASGGQLLQHIDARSPMDEKDVKFYLAEIILGVEALHEAGILHRDLKPENVLMQSNGHLVITDFGCSIQSKEPGKAPTSRAFVGTDMYMAPEQVMKQEYSEAVDWWAVGVLAWEMLTSKNPFEGKTKEVTLKKILTGKLALPSYLDSQTHSLLKGLLHKDPKCRLRKAADIKSHSFFKGVKWDQMLALGIPPPFVPDVDGPDSLKYVRPKYLEQTLQPAVETPVHDSPLAQRVREEGASLFQGFSFERPSLLQRRRGRPCHKPVEDCFQGLGLSANVDSAFTTCNIMHSSFGDCDAVSADSELASDRNSANPSLCESGKTPTQWFDIPPPDAFEETIPTSPADFCDIEDEILGGGRFKQGVEIFGNRPKGGRNKFISYTKHPAALTIGLPQDRGLGSVFDDQPVDAMLRLGTSEKPVLASADEGGAAVGDWIEVSKSKGKKKR